MKWIKLLANYNSILKLANDVKIALEDKQLSETELRQITQELIDLLVRLNLVK